ncbi:MAG: hypothetical protein IPL61_19055 [Myxococcales bacterium]|nr:hypothetical protein [Myxococcales bacterium]
MSSVLRSLGVVVMTLAVACSTPPPSPAKDLATAAASPSPAALIDVRPLTISFRGQVIARLFADGRTESAGPNAPGTALVPGPTLHADGTIVLTRPGVTARLDATGDLYVTDTTGARPREARFGRVADDRFTFAGSDRPWDVRVEGALPWFSPEDSSQLDGVVTSSVRHTARVMAAAFYVEGALGAP